MPTKEEIKVVQKLWGYETIPVNNDRYCGKILTVLPNGMACSIHYHKKKKETFYVLSGKLHLQLFRQISPGSTDCFIDDEIRLRVGEAITIDPLTPHRFWSLESQPCDFIEFSTPDDPQDSYRLVEAGPIPPLF